MNNPTQQEYPIEHIALEAEVHSYTAHKNLHIALEHILKEVPNV